MLFPYATVRFVFILMAAFTAALRAQDQPPAPAAAPPGVFEAPPTLSAAAILKAEFYQGPNFQVRDPVPTYAGANAFTIDSDFGVFTADGNAMLMRRVAEIHGIATLQAMSQTSEFTQAAAQAAETPLNVAQDLVTNPLPTIASVPRGILSFLNQAGQAVKDVAEGDQTGLGQGQLVENLSGFAKTKRALAIKVGVDPYCNNEVFQRELNKVAWPAFLGKFAVDLGMGAISGGAGATLSGLNWTATLQNSLRSALTAEAWSRWTGRSSATSASIPSSARGCPAAPRARSPTTTGLSTSSGASYSRSRRSVNTPRPFSNTRRCRRAPASTCMQSAPSK